MPANALTLDNPAEHAQSLKHPTVTPVNRFSSRRFSCQYQEPTPSQHPRHANIKNPFSLLRPDQESRCARRARAPTIANDPLPAIPAIHHVINRTGKLDSQLALPYAELCRPRNELSLLLTDPFTTVTPFTFFLRAVLVARIKNRPFHRPAQ
jgi:hypothetical protein